MKKILALLLAGVIMISVCACASPGKNGAGVSSEIAVPTINVAAINGPSGIAMAKLAKDNADAGDNAKYNIEFVSTPDALVGKIASGELDIACVPTNLAAALYNKTSGNVQAAAVSTLGVLYLIDTSGKFDLSGDWGKALKGKTIYASGQGSNPEYILNEILQKHGLTPGKDVTIEYKSEHAELAALAVAGKAELVMLPVPFTTQVLAKNKSAKVAADLQKEWEKFETAQMAQTLVIVRKDFAEKYKSAFNEFLDSFKQSCTYATQNVNDTAELVKSFGIMPYANIAKAAIPQSNIVYIEGGEMKAMIQPFLNVLFKANPKSVGGKLPGEDFYYTR